ncbi:autophagy protein 5 [Rickenella mellea]|uniref:Autophagy protein 5 n=1 Tax=Rickenella mellea TaxID=50990 RepID=A0A4Y7Q5G9_9AGAM|nr:autophagy protein 5 [Rickenella mellea]
MATYGRHEQVASAFSTPASTTLFRRLSWEGTVPIEIRVDSKELPANSDRGLECYFIQAPRVSYLPLLIPELKRFLVDVVFDEAAGKAVKEDEWWFESEDGVLMKWHWPIGVLYDNHTISASMKSRATFERQSMPLRLTLHLLSPPTDKLLLSPSAEACKQAFMGQMKEADFLRWGNTKRMTGLRKAEQDGIWEGVKEHNFDDYWRVSSKITPTTTPTRPHSPPPTSISAHSRPPSADGNAPDKDGAYNVRSVPVRMYLPDGPVLQDLAPPTIDDGSPTTLGSFLATHLPLLFTQGRAKAYALIQGVVCPYEAEMAWLGACMAGADGWVNIMVGIERH